MNVRTLRDMIEEFGTQKALAKHLDVPPQYLTRWLKMGVVLIDGKPFRPVIEIKRM